MMMDPYHNGILAMFLTGVGLWPKITNDAKNAPAESRREDM
jgi:hypothetical protein